MKHRPSLWLALVSLAACGHGSGRPASVLEALYAAASDGSSERIASIKAEF